jgi:hypothetical protein
VGVNKSIENVEQEAGAETVPLMLLPGKWKSFLSENEYKTLVAAALNECVVEIDFVIAGYLISIQHVYLVLKINKSRLANLRELFFEKVEQSLLSHFATLMRKGVPFIPSMKIIQPGDKDSLFEQYFFDDRLLLQLLMNEKRDLPFFDPQLMKMKEWLGSSDFCSYNLQAGEIGPVLTRKPADWPMEGI